ncbi:divergent polysaccharide deacteylase family protein [uncultured Sulfitobacter sp.]|uniref:divergent polysaccharide deacteylase family protein n=1 Tax=uncultured Sulfitobacter sp. TaxID=191468 RepID=UPI002614615D|nr:divergent polysaccharide deacteylase family protein [uncultured Sulfitobacter sp.]
MARGVLSGIGLGAIFSIGVAGAISVLVPIEPARAPEIGNAGDIAVAGDGAPQPAARVSGARDTAVPTRQPQITMRAPSDAPVPSEPPAAAQAPQTSSQAPDSMIAPSPQTGPVSAPMPERDNRTTEPAAPEPVDSVDLPPEIPQPLAQPETGQAVQLRTPLPLPESVAATLEADAPVLPNPQALAPMIPDDAPDGTLSPDSAANPDAAPSAVGRNDTLPVAAEPSVPTPELESADGAGAETESAAQARPRILPAPGTGAAVSSGRPRIGTPASTLATQNAPDIPEEAVAQTDPAMQQPITRYAADFDNPDDKPLMSILLIDDGTDLDAGGIGLPALGSFPYPLSFAVDAALPDARARMDRYRAEGFEVMAMVDLPQGARPSDAEVSLAATLDDLPQIVGVLDGTGEGLQGSREVADQVTAILKGAGLGLVAQSKGLDSMPKLAVKNGVPAAAVFRDFDSNDQGARVIRRFLDQAAFKAGQEGSVIMQGRLRPETIEALLVWGLADRASTVALAPISATLLARQ